MALHGGGRTACDTTETNKKRQETINEKKREKTKQRTRAKGLRGRTNDRSTNRPTTRTHRLESRHSLLKLLHTPLKLPHLVAVGGRRQKSRVRRPIAPNDIDTQKEGRTEGRKDGREGKNKNDRRRMGNPGMCLGCSPDYLPQEAQIERNV